MKNDWNEMFAAYKSEYPSLAQDLERTLAGNLPDGWDAEIGEFPAHEKGLATRAASGKVLNAIAPNLLDLIGGSADLTPSYKNMDKMVARHFRQKRQKEGTCILAFASMGWGAL